MTVPVAKAAFLALLFSFIPAAIPQQASGQSKDAGPKAVEYKAGQVWETDLRTLATILKVEDIPKIGRVIHIRVERVPVQSCGGFHLTTTIEHIALTEKMMRKSATDLVKENVDVPDSYFESYKQWERQKKHQVLKEPLSDIIASIGSQPGPMICNFLPAELHEDVPAPFTSAI
jgi:hypothetical protein